MPKIQKSGSQNDKSPNVKPFETGSRGGFENKEKFPLWAYPETLEAVEQSYRGDNCKSKSEFIDVCECTEASKRRLYRVIVEQ